MHLETTDTRTPDDSAAIREQLSRILQSPQFRNSKRSQALLRFVTSRVLENRTDELREKIIGFSVFGREIAYDTGHDAIVRNVAIEVRKRLAQYYMEDVHDNELRIELPAGSYMPSFLPARQLADAGKSDEQASTDARSTSDKDLEIKTPFFRARSATRIPFLLGGTGFLCVIVTICAYFVFSDRRTDFDHFWAPILDTKRPVQIIVGQPTAPCRFFGTRATELNAQFHALPHSPATDDKTILLHQNEIYCQPGQYLYKGDAFAMARLSALVQSKKMGFRLATDSMVEYSELRDSPVIAIGASNNNWAQRLINNTRYSLAKKQVNGQTISYVADAANPGATRWVISIPQPDQHGILHYDDYAVITRIQDSNTSQVVYFVAGNFDAGTRAASEFITDPSQVNTMLKNSSLNWRKNNIQIVLQTRVLDGVPGPAKVVAIYSW